MELLDVPFTVTLPPTVATSGLVASRVRIFPAAA
nr:MAG TPA: hypothetical protein [Caudoviricetes sp.]